MWPFIANTVFPATLTAFAGVIAWVAANFFADPLLRFYRLRTAVHEFLFFNANVSAYRKEPAIENARIELRRHAASFDALAATSSQLVKWWLAERGYNLTKAAKGLTGFSNSLELEEGEKALHRDQIESALRFEKSYTVETLKLIAQARQRRVGS